MQRYSRRGFAGLLAALFFRPRLHSQATGAPSAPPEANATRAASRTYRADAVILFLGLTIFRRAGVGGGRVSLEETGEGASLRRTFFFAGGSDPKRAHGLNRLGWMREVVGGAEAAPVEAAYFGVLTSSPEESLELARKSVAEPQSGRSIFSAVNGTHRAGRSRSAVTHFEFAAGALWSDQSLIEHAQSTFHGDVEWHETAWPNSPRQAPPTFLFQMATLLKQRARRAEGRYVYHEQEYLMVLERPQAGPDRERLLAFRGKIRNLGTGHETLFRLWLDGGSDSIVPVRIEFQARSFLRLTFEAVPA